MEQLCANARRSQKIKEDRAERKGTSGAAPTAERKVDTATDDGSGGAADDGLQPTGFRIGDWISLQDGAGHAMAHGKLCMVMHFVLRCLLY
jgi:hypothetical protein